MNKYIKKMVLNKKNSNIINTIQNQMKKKMKKKKKKKKNNRLEYYNLT